MGKPTGFKEWTREGKPTRPTSLRVLDWREVYDEDKFDEALLKRQAGRCMDCGIPFCHQGCPLGNIIPEWNDLVYRDDMKKALAMLHRTNNFPEFTGKVCPAPCEESCVLNINDKPVAIKLVEESIIEYGFREGWVQAELPQRRTGKRVAVIGSGPAGLACAAQLNRAGHSVEVFERDDRAGGLLIYGIPNFKLEKHVVDRRLKLLEEEGIVFNLNANVGFNVEVDTLRREFDAICLAGGATKARELDVAGRELKGIYRAMEYLSKQNRVNLGDQVPEKISAKGKHVIILGGGDTGADCLGTAIRQGAASVSQFELMPRPPEERTAEMPWPLWPMILRTSSAHEEGGIRDWSINTKSFSGENGVIKKLHGVRLEWQKNEGGKYAMKEIAGSEFELNCDLCLLAMGFVHPEHEGPIEQLGLELDARGNVKCDLPYATNVPGVFSAGDMRRGQSLVVWAITEGREAAREIDKFLMGMSNLP